MEHGKKIKITHLDTKGQARMVDVTKKNPSHRRALARARVKVSEELFNALKEGVLDKGDALAAARIAGIQAAKKTSELIPLCHPLPISHVGVDITLKPPDAVIIETEVRTHASTGAEMEALTAAAVSALTIYDMGKAADRGMVIEEIMLLEKSGGKSGKWARE